MITPEPELRESGSCPRDLPSSLLTGGRLEKALPPGIVEKFLERLHAVVQVGQLLRRSCFT
jgi:hypothetical protein